MGSLDREFTLHRLPEIEYQVKTIGYLDGFGCAAAGALGVEAVTISAHHDHFRVFSQPLAKSIRRTCREKIDHFHVNLGRTVEQDDLSGRRMNYIRHNFFLRFRVRILIPRWPIGSSALRHRILLPPSR